MYDTEREVENMTIRRKLNLLLIFVVASLLGTGYLLYGRIDGIFSTQTTTAGEEGVGKAGAVIGGRIGEFFSITKSVAASAAFVMENMEGSERADIISLMETKTKAFKERGIVDVYMGFASDGGFADGGGWVPPEGYDCRTRSWYMEGLKAGKTVLTSPYVDGITKKTIVSIVSPVKGKNGVLGVAGVDMDIEFLSKFVQGLGVLGKGTGVLLAADGTVVASGGLFVPVETNLSSVEGDVEKLAKNMSSGKPGRDNIVVEETEYLVFHAPAGSGLSLALFFPSGFVSERLEGIRKIALFGAGTLVLLVSVVVFTIGRNISKYAKDVVESAERVSGGDISKGFPVKGRDEFASISESLNTMTESVSKMVETVSSESKHLDEGSESLAALSEETVAAMEEVAASVSKITEMTGTVASLAGNVSRLSGDIAHTSRSGASESRESAEKAGSAENELVGTAESLSLLGKRIEEASAESSAEVEKISDLETRVGAISDFMGTIASIADRTNLLALNAAIEAARAGEQGRGFAVVAEEVRNLAESSAKAADDVTKLVSVLKRDMMESVSASKKTKSSLDAAAHLSSEAARKLGGVVKMVGDVKDVLSDSASISEDTEKAAAELAKGGTEGVEFLGNMAEVVKNVEDASRETALAAESVAEKAQALLLSASKIREAAGMFRT